MSSEMELVKWSETPEVWYNRLSVEEKYDAYQHPDCPRQIGILPLPREPQWVLEWSESILDLSILLLPSVSLG